MVYDQANTYETIELFGLTEKDAELPIQVGLPLSQQFRKMKSVGCGMKKGMFSPEAPANV